jgi:hypothetical protein
MNTDEKLIKKREGKGGAFIGVNARGRSFSSSFFYRSSSVVPLLFS